MTQDQSESQRKLRLRQARYYQKNKVRYKDRIRARELRRKYGITVAQYDKMLALQGGVCKLCARPPKIVRLSVDHSHHAPDKGRVRGLLCIACNRFHVSKNTAASARALVAYLESAFDGRGI